MVWGGSSPVVLIATAASFGSWHLLPGDLLFSPFFLLNGVHFCDWALMWGGWAGSCIREWVLGSWPGKRSVLSRAVCSGAPSSGTCRIGFSVPWVCTLTSSNPQECTGSERRHWEWEGLEGTGGALDN